MKKHSKNTTSMNENNETDVYLDCDIEIPSFTNKKSGVENFSNDKFDVDFLLSDDNSTSLTNAKTNWYFGQWHQLIALDISKLNKHPERDKFALLKASAYQQLGDYEKAANAVTLAREWGCDNKLIAQVLIAGVHNSLGKIAAISQNHAKLKENFRAAVTIGNTSYDVKLASQARTVNEITGLGLLQDGVNYLETIVNVEELNKLRPAERTANINFVQNSLNQIKQKQIKLEQKMNASQAEHDITKSEEADIQSMLDDCFRSDDFLLTVDQYLLNDEIDSQAKFELCCALFDEFIQRKDNLMAQHFVNTACDFLSSLAHQKSNQRLILARMLLTLGRKNEALELSLGVINDHDLLTEQETTTLLAPIHSFVGNKIKSGEHGHDLLLDYLIKNPVYIDSIKKEHLPVLIEIGTTRENVAGQGSTRKLAEYCHGKQINFITVDMDEHNGRVANSMFRHLGYDYLSVTMKGEDYLAAYDGQFDFVFLDAYDFDHGKHSKLRQSRYEKFLGNKIDEELCHKMHLDCAKSVLDKLTKDGLVCIDDTWQDEDGKYTAKGTTAVPFLLENGFEIIVERNRAVLMRRKK